MTEYARAGGATTACEAAGSSPLSVPAHRTGGNRAACRAVIPPLAAAAAWPGSVRRPVLAVRGTPGPGRPEMTGGAGRCPRGQVPGTVVPLMLAFSRSDAARA
jgi:hypothetical protein